MASNNIFSGLKVVDLRASSQAQRRGDLVRLGADVIKVEPPSGDLWRMRTTCHRSRSPRMLPWHSPIRNKRGMALDLSLQAPSRSSKSSSNGPMFLIVNTPHPRAHDEARISGCGALEPRLIYRTSQASATRGRMRISRFDITSYWARSGLLSMTRDAGVPPTWPVGCSGDNATAVGLYSAIVTALYRRERTGEGRMSRPRCLPKACGPQASRSRLRYVMRNLWAARSQESSNAANERLSR